MEQPDHAAPGNIFLPAVAVEGGLALLALLIGGLIGLSPLASVPLSADALTRNAAAVLYGALAALPLLPILVVVERSRWSPLVKLRTVVDELLIPLFAETSIVQLAVISALAGVGEEMLFRGLIQTGIAETIGSPWGIWAALLLTSVLFGFAHAITLAYVVLAALVGAYLGGLLLVSGNLLAPIVAHGLYDFLALLYLLKWRGPRQSAQSESSLNTIDNHTTDNQ